MGVERKRSKKSWEEIPEDIRKLPTDTRDEFYMEYLMERNPKQIAMTTFNKVVGYGIIKTERIYNEVYNKKFANEFAKGDMKKKFDFHLACTRALHVALDNKQMNPAAQILKVMAGIIESPANTLNQMPQILRNQLDRDEENQTKEDKEPALKQLNAPLAHLFPVDFLKLKNTQVEATFEEEEESLTNDVSEETEQDPDFN